MAAENLRAQILQAAQKLFQEHGWGNVTMEDVGRAVGKGKSTLYYYFKSKEEIFDAVLHSEINDVIMETIRQTSSHEGTLRQLIVFCGVKLEMAIKRKSLYRTMEAGIEAAERSKLENIKLQVHRQYLAREQTVLQQIFMKAMTAGEIPVLSDDELNENILIFLAAVRGINREIILHGTQQDSTAMIQRFCHLFYSGLKA